MQDRDVNEYVLTYLRKYETNAGIRDIIPTSELIEELINKITTISTNNRVQKQDLLHKLEALQITLEENKNINQDMYDKMGLPTADDIKDAVDDDTMGSMDTEEFDSMIGLTASINEDSMATLSTQDNKQSTGELILKSDTANDDVETKNSTPPNTPTLETMPSPDPDDVLNDYLQSDAVTDIMTRVEDNVYYTDRQRQLGSNTDQFKQELASLQKLVSRVSSFTTNDKKETLTQLNRVSKIVKGDGKWMRTLDATTFPAKLEELKINTLLTALQSDTPITLPETRKTTQVMTMSDLPKDTESIDDKAQGKTRTGSGIRSRRKIYKFRK
jgi:hypothetical protein